jgi:hypothetical protein
MFILVYNFGINFDHMQVHTINSGALAKLVRDVFLATLTKMQLCCKIYKFSLAMSFFHRGAL